MGGYVCEALVRSGVGAFDLIDSDTLGKAFEPEQRFENPDGTPITFDTDFEGKKREGQILPGPFAGEF